MRPTSPQFTDHQDGRAVSPPPLFEIDWPDFVAMVARATNGTMHVLECDRMTTAFGLGVRVTMLVPIRLLDTLARLGLEPDAVNSAAHGGAALSVRNCEVGRPIDPLCAGLAYQPELHGRSIESVVSGMPRCDVIVLGDDAVGAVLTKEAIAAIARARPIVVLRSPRQESHLDAFCALIENLDDYRWLSQSDFTDAVTRPFDHNLEAIAAGWPIERPLPTSQSATSFAQRDLLARSDTPRPRFRTQNRSSARPLDLDLPISRMTAARGLWGIERDELGEFFRWGGAKEKISLYFEVPWPGTFSVSIRIYPPIPIADRSDVVFLLNGVAVQPTYREDRLFATANLFRHGLIELVVPPPPSVPMANDPRRLTCCVRGVRIQEIVR